MMPGEYSDIQFHIVDAAILNALEPRTVRVRGIVSDQARINVVISEEHTDE